MQRQAFVAMDRIQRLALGLDGAAPASSLFGLQRRRRLGPALPCLFAQPLSDPQLVRLLLRLGLFDGWQIFGRQVGKAGFHVLGPRAIDLPRQRMYVAGPVDRDIGTAFALGQHITRPFQSGAEAFRTVGRPEKGGDVCQ